MSSHRVAIIGGGISGLSAAYYLARRGVESVLVEKEPRLGGLIQTEHLEGCLLEAGPDSFLSAKPAVNELAEEMEGLDRQIISSNDAARRVYIVRAGKLVALPRGMSMMVPGELLPALGSELFSFRTKVRFLSERFNLPRERPGDFSVRTLVEEHFGIELLEYVADPLLAGVYGGDSASLSARSVLPRFVEYEERLGSLIRGVRQERKPTLGRALFQSFASGMETLTSRLQIAVRDRSLFVHCEALSVTRQGGSWRIWLGEGNIEAEHLVLACPAHRAARLLEEAAPEISAALAEISYASAILVSLVYRAEDIHHPLNGFGFLVPNRERNTIAAATWINRKFPNRIAPGLIGIRTFVVGAEALALLKTGDDELARLVRQDLQKLMGIHAEPRLIRVHRWPESMPQYVVGHQGRVRRIRELTDGTPWLHLIGNAYDGVGIPDCVRLARDAAERITANINANQIKSL